MVEETRTDVIASMFKVLSVPYDQEKLTMWAHLFRDTDIMTLGDACKHLMNEHEKMRVLPKHLREAIKAVGGARFARHSKGLGSMCERCSYVYRLDSEIAQHLVHCLEMPAEPKTAEKRWREMGKRAHTKGYALATAIFGPLDAKERMSR